MIHLLRAINVGGHNKIPMAQLRTCYERLGLKNVKTYIQSGNVFFSSSTVGNDELESSITEVTGFSIPGFLFTDDEWLDITAHAPSEFETSGKELKKYIAFTNVPISGTAMETLNAKATSQEVFSRHGRALFLHYPADLKKPFSSNASIEKIIGQPATTRNWNTLKALAKMIRENA